MTSGPDHPPYIAVVGPGDGARERDLRHAREVGRRLAARGAVLVTGGLGGVMAAASAGARGAGGRVVGLLPGTDRAAGNPDLTIALPTGLGQFRNGLVVSAADAVIAVGGSWGTLSEVALARRAGTAVVVLDGWQVADADGRRVDLPAATTPADAVEQALAGISARPEGADG